MHIDEEQKMANDAATESLVIAESAVMRFARVLRETREQAGFTIERVALASRISLGLLKAMEECHIERLPGHVFVRGFVRNLCKLYHTDPAELLLLAEEAMGKDAADSKPQPLKKEDPKWDLTHEQRHWRSRRIKRAGALFIARHFQLVPLISFVIILALIGSGFFYMIKLLAGIPEGLYSVKSVGQAISSEFSGNKIDAGEVGAKKLTTGTAVKISQFERQPSSVIFFESKMPQTLEIKANQPVQVEMQKDGDSVVGLQLEPKNHHVMFNEHAELMIHDAGSVQLSLDGKILEPVAKTGQSVLFTFKKIAQIKQKSKRM